VIKNYTNHKGITQEKQVNHICPCEIKGRGLSNFVDIKVSWSFVGFLQGALIIDLIIRYNAIFTDLREFMV
jgi:hypothetical protein